MSDVIGDTMIDLGIRPRLSLSDHIHGPSLVGGDDVRLSPGVTLRTGFELLEARVVRMEEFVDTLRDIHTQWCPGPQCLVCAVNEAIKAKHVAEVLEGVTHNHAT